MNEREEIFFEIRDRLSANMTELFDIITTAYRKCDETPVFQGKFGRGGTVTKLLINHVPRGVMSDIFDGFMEAKAHVMCGYALEAHINSEMDDFCFSVQITKNRTSG